MQLSQKTSIKMFFKRILAAVKIILLLLIKESWNKERKEITFYYLNFCNEILFFPWTILESLLTLLHTTKMIKNKFVNLST